MTNERKTQIALAVIIIAATIGAHKLILSDRMKTNEALRVSNESKQSKLLAQNRNWTLSRIYLTNLKEQYEKNSNKRFDDIKKVFSRANNEFTALYDHTNVGISVNEWQDGLMVFSFSEMFWDVKNSLKDRGINLDETVLEMTDKKTVPRQRLYRKLAHLHVVREIALMAQRNKLTLSHKEMTAAWCADNRKPNNFSEQPAMITVLKPRTYFADGGAGNSSLESFVDEFPVEIRVRGRLGDLTKFLYGLTANNRYLPLDRIEIKAIGADRYLKFSTIDLSQENQIEAKIICSGFLVVTDSETLDKKLYKPKGKLKPHKGA